LTINFISDKMCKVWDYKSHFSALRSRAVSPKGGESCEKLWISLRNKA